MEDEIKLLIKGLKICIDSLVWIANNSINDAVRFRAKDTVEEVNNIFDKLNTDR